MAKFKLALGLHNHQPVGNFGFVFEDCHRQAYDPFLRLIERFPSIRFSLHQSGILWRWQEQNHPGYLELVRNLHSSGRIELLTGGFYEPILISVPERDALGQISMLNNYLEEQFGAQPNGLWLTERIWEPHLPKLLARAGVKFLPIDDTHFLYAGMELDQLTGPFVTEHEGHQVTLLPIQKRLRYLIPFGKVEEVIDELRRQAERQPDGMAVYADDGEKFGSWPDTNKHCYDDGWLEQFFAALQDCSDWLEVIPLGEALQCQPAGRAYLPSASYAEMLHWALPPQAGLEYEHFEEWLKDAEHLDQYGRFVRGGHWRGFLAKYEEANLMHKRMLAVSERLDACDIVGDDTAAARDNLFAAQCNCPYWHGVFGGLYLPHIRQAIHQHLLAAEHLLDQAEGLTGVTSTVTDFNHDGHNEVILSSPKLSAVVKPSHGGTLLELGLKDPAFDLTDTLTRRREAYHLKLDQAISADSEDTTASIHDIVRAKEDNLKDFLVDDWYLKRCCIDHFFPTDVTLDGFARGQFGEEGDFIVEPYEVIATTDDSVTLRREGHLWRPEGPIPVSITKRFTVNEAGKLSVEYELVNPSGGKVEVLFAVENNFNLQAGHDADRYVAIDGVRPESSWLDDVAEHPEASAVAMCDRARDVGVVVSCDCAGRVWRCPIFTVSLSEGGFERVYQGTTLVQLHRLRLSGEPTRLRFDIAVGHLERLAVKHQEATVAD